MENFCGNALNCLIVLKIIDVICQDARYMTGNFSVSLMTTYASGSVRYASGRQQTKKENEKQSNLNLSDYF